jgi:hypothetical protein
MRRLFVLFPLARSAFEILLVAPLYEIYLRGRSFLDPRTRRGVERIRQHIDGSLIHHSGEVAIFATSHNGIYPAFFLNLFKALKQARIDVLIISNRDLSDDVIEQLRPHCRWLLIRENIGRDFGAYADAIRFLSKQNLSQERLFLFNDSLFYRDEGLVEQLIDPMRGHAFSAATVSQVPLLHAQSFCVSFGKTLLEHPAFRAYWEKYRPIDTRRWAISRGELGLSVALTSAGFKPVAVYSHARVARTLLENMVGREADILRLVPRLPSKAQKAFGVQLVQFQPFVLLDDLARLLENYSTIHFCGFLLWRFTGMPIMKRDLVYRGVFSPVQTIAFMDAEPGEGAQLMIVDLFSRGEGRLLPGLAGFRFRNGFS